MFEFPEKDKEFYQKQVDSFCLEANSFDKERLRMAINACESDLTYLDKVLINCGFMNEPARLRGYKARLEDIE